LKFIAALKFLTIIPLFRHHLDTAEEIGGSIVYYPVVGLIIGLVLVGLGGLLRVALDASVSDGLLIVFLVIITGALHLDGFVDTCDGIAGHRSVEERWRVMHDSRTGAFGVVGAILLLLLKYVALNSIQMPMVVVALMPVLGRWAMVYSIFAYPYARPEGLGKVLKQAATWQRFLAATVIALVISIGVAGWANIRCFYLAGPAIMLSTWVIIVVVASYFRRMFAGLTGDTYGAINEIAEVSVLLLIALLEHNNWLIYRLTM
jgi:adenosylcobinamide-GDP ribazoletransferase